jgi:hypothetical protein
MHGGGKMIRQILLAGTLGLLAVPVAAAGLTVTVNADVSSGQAAFGAATDLLVWRNLFGPTASWTLGAGGGSMVNGIGTFSDPANGGTATGSFHIWNWLDGPGFGNGPALPDLAINFAENWVLGSSSGWRNIGFAVSTGVGLYASEVSPGPVSFSISTSAGAASFTLPGAGHYWISISSPTPLTSWSFTEAPPAAFADQYFGNVVASNTLPGAGAVPEPGSWAMLLLGFGLAGAVQRRSRRRQAVPQPA